MPATSAAGGRRWPVFLRVLRTEVLRGGAVLTGVAATLALVYELFGGVPTWGGYWLNLGVALRSALELVGALVVAGAAWAAGRERRRGMGELLGSTARPPWQRLTLTWGSTTLAATVGMALVWAAAAVLVARVASYDGERVWHPLVAVVSVAMLAAAGAAIGRFVPWRGAAPVAAIVVFYALAFAGSGQLNAGSMWLSPSLPGWMGQTLHLSADGAILELVWFAALTVALLVVIGARRRVWVLAPALIAIVAATPLVQGPGQDRWLPSDAATQEVCSGDAPRVCVSQASAFLLDDLVRQVDEVWPRLEGVAGAPRVFREPSLADPARDAQTVPLYFSGSDLQGRLEWDRWQGYDLVRNIVAPLCLAAEDGGPGWSHESAVVASAGLLVSGRSTPAFDLPFVLPAEDEQVSVELSARLDGLSAADQRAWLGRYLTAARSTGPCDAATLDALVDGA